jgi:hypothetical protein
MAQRSAADADGDELTRLRAEVASLRNELDQARQAAPPSDDTVALDQADGSGRGHRADWWRTPVVALLITVGALMAPLAVLATWAHDEIGDTDRYVETVTPLASDPAVQDALVTRITTEIFSRLDVRALTQEAVDALQAQGLPPRVADGLDALAVPLANGVRNFVTDRVERIITSPEFQQAWVEANRQAHAQLVAVLTGKDTDTVEVSGNAVSINLATVIEMVKEQLVQAGFSRAGALPTVNAQFTVFESADLAKAQSGFRYLDATATWLPFVALALLALAVYLARTRRRALLAAALAVAGSMLLLGATLNIFRPVYLNAIAEQDLDQGAAASIYDQLVGFIRLNLRAVLAVSLAVAAGAWLSGASTSAVTVRRGITGALAAVRGGGERVGLRTGPVGAFVYRYRTLLRVLVIAVAALVYIQAAHPTGGWTLSVLGYTVLALLVVELLGRPPAAADLPAPGPAAPA